MNARGSSALRWVLPVGVLAPGVVELVRGLGHLVSEDSAAAGAGVETQSVTDADVVYLSAVVGGTQALLGVLLVVSALLVPPLRVAAVAVEAARCAGTRAVGLAKPSTADGLVGGVPDTAQLLWVLGLLGLFVAQGRAGGSEALRRGR